MELETIDRLYLELSQVTTAKTARELKLEDLLRSAANIAERGGKDVNWARWTQRLHDCGIHGITAKTFRVLASDHED
jgi:hypothetical protein